ncbi:MAG TPA: CBS domain-containing protein [Chloroflexia bacterium]|nr:CBS domain-containing protein [Chloroflexia bacterium]
MNGTQPLDQATPIPALRTAAPAAGTPLRVGDYMTARVKTVAAGTPVLDAYYLMIQQGIRRLPVVRDEQLVGIVTLGDLREARPSPATSLSTYELNYLLAKLTVEQVMTHQPFVVTPETSIKEAAGLMLAHKIGGLPVVDATHRLVGILTESDLFRVLLTQL